VPHFFVFGVDFEDFALITFSVNRIPTCAVPAFDRPVVYFKTRL